MQVHDSLVELVGNTPLLRLRKVTSELAAGGHPPQVLAKVEYFNPGGSVKDRIALRMIQARDPSLVGRPFFARYDPRAVWLSDLRPAFAPTFPFEQVPPEPSGLWAPDLLLAAD